MQESAEEQEWFEVFFDLVFAVAVAFWAERVARDPRLVIYLASLSFLLPIWWIWLGQTVYAMRFGEASPRVQALALVQVIGVGVMATQLLEEQGPTGRFAVGYLIARGGLLVLYVLAARRSRQAASVARVYLAGFAGGAALWAASLWLPGQWRMVAWAVGLCIDFAVPWIGRPTLQQMPLDSRRLPERVGTFTSLLLGVSVEGIIRGLAETGWHVTSVSLALLSFICVMSLWWIYAARINRANFREVLGSGQPYLYCQFLVVLGVGTSSVGIRVVQADRSPTEAATGLALVSAGAVLWILGMVLIRQVVLKHRDRYWYAPFLAAAAALPVVAVVGARHPPGALAGLVALVLGLALIELRHGRRHTTPGHRL